MNTPLVVVQATRIGFLVLLWVFVFAALRVIRADLFGSAQPRMAAMPVRPGPRPAKPKRRGKTPRQLLVVDGALTGTKITLAESPIMIGRADDSTLVLTDDYASSRHARLTPRDGDWYLEDLGSTNGTYLDRTKVSGPIHVPPGVPIRIGKTVLELRA
jgi:hypothetical protein